MTVVSFKPMLATAPGPKGVGKFPVMGTPKVDGIRAVMLHGHLVSRTLKPIPNIALRAALESVLPDGTDGEATYGSSFSSSTSAIMSHVGPPSGYTYYIFDYVGRNVTPQTPYIDRMAELSRLISENDRRRRASAIEDVVDIVVLNPTYIKDAAALNEYEAIALRQGFEGVIVRAPNGRYKYGRSTPTEGLMIKVKRFDDAEAEVTGFDRLVHENEEEGANRGEGQLGALVAIRPDGVTFKIGTGFTTQQRKDYWLTRSKLIGQIVKYRFFGIGSSEASAPRFPTFIGFRDPRDM